MVTIAVTGIDGRAGRTVALAARAAGADEVVGIGLDLADALEAADERRVAHLVYVSSARVYGAHADNPVPIAETQPLRPNGRSLGAVRAAALDELVRSWADERPDVAVTVLRAAPVVGEDVDDPLGRHLAGPRLAFVAGHRPPFQFLHLDDLAAAVAHVIAARVVGTYNVAPPGWLSTDEVAAITGRRQVTVPEEVALAVAARAARASAGGPPAGQLPYLMHPWVVDPSELIATGWRPRRSNRDALAALADADARRVVVGPLETTRGRLRGASAVVGAAGVVASALVVRRVRRRRRG